MRLSSSPQVEHAARPIHALGVAEGPTITDNLASTVPSRHPPETLRLVGPDAAKARNISEEVSATTSDGMLSGARAVLERIALHQTRLHTPGLGLDAKGVALGGKGLVLLPSIDRLVALLSVYTREKSLEDLTPSLAMNVVKSKLGTREITLEFAAESSDRMDRLAETARLVGGFTFTGTARHFVQYRDAAAPFGYDATELLSTDAALALYHDRFSQTYDVERRIELRPLLLRLMPHLDPSTKLEPGPCLIVAEQGLGPALVHYLVRSRVEGEVGVAEWPPESAFDDAPVRRWIFRIPELPRRMRPLIARDSGNYMFHSGGLWRGCRSRLPPPRRASCLSGLRRSGAGPRARPWGRTVGAGTGAADGGPDGVRTRRDAHVGGRGFRIERDGAAGNRSRAAARHPARPARGGTLPRHGSSPRRSRCCGASRMPSRARPSRKPRWR